MKKANEPGQVMQVHEFLGHVRRMVVDFVVGRVLSHNGGTEAVTGLDDITTYYLLHRNDFGLDDAPAGACILYAVSCGLSDTDLADRYELLVRSGGQEAPESEEEDTMWAEDEDDAEIVEGTGSTVRLRPWNHRKRKDLGLSSDGRPATMIDQIHKLMHLWKGGDLTKVDEYLDSHGLRGNQLFLLPDGPYDLWKKGETSRRVKDLVGAFAQFPHLPKMLRRDEIVRTLAQGAKDGLFVLQATRPDRSMRTIWRTSPATADLADASLEVVLTQTANLTELAPDLLVPGVLPMLWKTPTVTVREILDYFVGNKTVAIAKEGYTETLIIPKADRSAVEIAIRGAVETGKLWLISGPASILGEPIPAGVLTEGAELSGPPSPIPASDVLTAKPGDPQYWSQVLDCQQDKFKVPCAIKVVEDIAKQGKKAVPKEIDELIKASVKLATG